jgi:hypothetical protein
MNHLRTVALVVLAGPIVFPAGKSFGQLKYVDEAGTSHYVQSEAMVPEQYRAKTKSVGSLPSVNLSGSMQAEVRGGSLLPSRSSGQSRMEREDEERKQNMKRAAEENLKEKHADQRKRDDYNRCVGSNSSSGSAGSTSYGRSSGPSCF